MLLCNLSPQMPAKQKRTWQEDEKKPCQWDWNLQLFFDPRNKPPIFVRHIANNMKKENVLTDEQKTMARFAKAMGHPIRMYVLDLLSRQTCCYSGDLTEVLPIAKSTLSQHLKELRDAGLIQGEIEAPKIKYCLNQENWELAKQLFARFLN